MEKIKIQKMTLEDFEKIEKSLLSDFDDFWSPNLLKSELMSENRIYLVAKENEEIVGFAGGMLNFPEMEIMNIVIKKTERRKGIGKILLEKLIEIANDRQVETIFLEVNEKNESARKLYEKVGFEEMSRRKNYYGESENAIILSKKIKNL